MIICVSAGNIYRRGKRALRQRRVRSGIIQIVQSSRPQQDTNLTASWLSQLTSITLSYVCGLIHNTPRYHNTIAVTPVANNPSTLPINSPPPNATTCPARTLWSLPPSCGCSVTDFWGWDAQGARLRRPYDNDKVMDESVVPGGARLIYLQSRII
jgi:hypothetical protein